MNADLRPTASWWTSLHRYHGAFWHYGRLIHIKWGGQPALTPAHHITWSVPAFTVDTTTN